jgi:hypothetical protein
VRGKLAAKPENYSWSSYRSYSGVEPAPPWLTTHRILDYFKNHQSSRQAAYRDFVEDLLTGEYVSPLQATIASTVLGSPEFVKKISQTHLPQTPNARNVPATRALRKHPTIEQILDTVQRELGQGPQTRNIALYCCQQFSGARLSDIGAHFGGISDAAVSQASRRLLLRAESNPQLMQILEGVRSQLLTGDQK